MIPRLCKYLIILFLFVPLLIKPQVIQNISISGAKIFPDKELQSSINIYKNRKYSEKLIDSLKIRIEKYCSVFGYYHPSISINAAQITGSKNYDVKITFEENAPTYFRNIYVQAGSKADSLDALSRFANLRNGIFSSGGVEGVIKSLLTKYENSGYPFALVKITSVIFDTDSSGRFTADIHIDINRNIFCRIQKIEVEGNTRTDAKLIIRSAGIQPGDIYSQAAVEDAAKQINKLRFFEPVETPSFYINDKNEGVLKIKVKEKETNSFDGIIGYVPAVRNTGGYFTGFINIGLRNLFGSGRNAGFRWQTETQYTQELELKYSEPWLFNLPFNFETTLFQRKQDTTYVQRNLEVKLEYLAAENFTAGLLVSTQSTIPSVTLSNSSVSNSTELITGFSLKYDSRDDPYSPTNGIYFNNIYKFIRKTITAGLNPATNQAGSDNFQRIEIDLNLYYSFFENQVAALSLHARELQSSNIEPSDYYFLGGTNTLRGYLEKQFAGNRLLWSNLEYRFLYSSRSFGFIFLDTGYFLRNENEAKNISGLSGFKVGYGLGINFETSLGVMSISFALANGDSFNQGKIHFGLLNEF